MRACVRACIHARCQAAPASAREEDEVFLVDDCIREGTPHVEILNHVVKNCTYAQNEKTQMQHLFNPEVCTCTRNAGQTVCQGIALNPSRPTPPRSCEVALLSRHHSFKSDSSLRARKAASYWEMTGTSEARMRQKCARLRLVADFVRHRHLHAAAHSYPLSLSLPPIGLRVPNRPAVPMPLPQNSSWLSYRPCCRRPVVLLGLRGAAG